MIMMTAKMKMSTKASLLRYRKEQGLLLIDEIRISKEKDYQPSVAAAITRRTLFSIKDRKLVAQHQYSIDRKNYIVNSIFDMDGRQSITDGVKHLIDTELEKAS